MVKGITRQVVLVKSPDPKLFEQAIFIVREEAMHREGVSDEQVLRQARQAANGFLRRTGEERAPLNSLEGLLWSLLGALGASLVWLLFLLLG